MQPEQFEGLLTHLSEAFSAESVIVATQDELAAHADDGVAGGADSRARARHGHEASRFHQRIRGWTRA